MKKCIYALLVIVVAAASSWSMDLFCNLAGIVYYGDQLVFKNTLYQGKWWYVCNTADIAQADETLTNTLRDNPAGILNADRYPIEAPWQGKGFAMHTLVSVWKDIFPEGTFTLEFEGTGEVKLTGLHSATVNGSGGKTTYTFDLLKSDIAWNTMGTMQRQPRNKESLRVGITKSQKTDPIRNLRVLLPGVTDYDDAVPFTDEFLSKIKNSPYTGIRFMDWGKVNYSKEVNWSERTTRSAITHAGGFEGKYPHGVAWEMMIDLCNLVDRDLWLCVPAYTTQDYWTELADLVYTRLEPERKVWIEYANEVWNGMFVGFKAAEAVSRAKNLAPVDKMWQHNNYGYTYQLVRIAETFTSRFGAQKNRIVPVLSGWANGVSWSQMRVAALKDATVNPNNLQVNHFATTTYFGAPAGTDEKLADGGNWRVHIDMCKQEGMQWISYEGGHGGTMPKNLLKNAYSYTLDKLKEEGCKLYNEFLMSNTWGAKTYGALEYYSQPTADAPKYDAICDFAATNNGFNRSNVDKVENWSGGTAVHHRSTGTFGRTAGVTTSTARNLFDLRGRMVSPAQRTPIGASMLIRPTGDHRLIISGMKSTAQK